MKRKQNFESLDLCFSKNEWLSLLGYCQEKNDGNVSGFIKLVVDRVIEGDIVSPPTRATRKFKDRDKRIHRIQVRFYKKEDIGKKDLLISTILDRGVKHYSLYLKSQIFEYIKNSA